MIKRIRNSSEFTKNIFVLISGTGISQAIPIAISPILTRIYSPKDFGLLGLYISICSMFGIIVSLRYDAAIIQSDNDGEAKQLVVVSFISSLFFCLLLFLIILFFNERIATLLNNNDIRYWLFSVPLSVFLVSALYIITFWLNKKKRFLDMSVNRVINKSTDSAVSLSSGFIGLIRQGLLLGYILGQFVMITLLFKKILKDNFIFNKKRARLVIRKYKEYPRFFLPSTILSEISSNVFLILMSVFYGSVFTGFYALVFRVTYLPLGLVGNSIGEVYRQKANEHYLEFGNCKALFIKTFKTLFVIGLMPFLVLFFFSEYLFVFVFGPEWKTAGEIAKYFSFLIFFQFVSTPLSFTIFLNKSQKQEMVLQFLRTVFTILSILIGLHYKDNMLGIIIMVFVYCIYYIFNSLLQYRAAIGS
ncbi:lipopolysaccharide biosynthesis protein [Flavobacterium sp.]|uniref:lipopolysaccharide biosynthesis protein n=1 Tax=Flavobacterium sp. TaxID=239 RepID=UPI003752F6F4